MSLKNPLQSTSSASLLPGTSYKHLPSPSHLTSTSYHTLLLQICEDLDPDSLGYVSSSILAKILKTLPGVRPEVLGAQASPKFYKGAPSGYSSNEQVNGAKSVGYATVSGSMFKQQKSQIKKARDGSQRGAEGGSAWLERQSGSSIPGKVNYRQLFKTVNLFDNSKPDDYDDLKRVARNLR